MSSGGYTPTFGTMLTGSLYGRWPHTGVWACLLSRVSREGVIDEHPSALAAAIGIPLDDLKRCLEDFMAPDPESRSTEHDGRRLILLDPARAWGWRVVNCSKYREKARKKTYDADRTSSGADAARKRWERSPVAGVPATPGASRDVPLSDSDSDSDSDILKKATDVAAERREEAKRLWPDVKAAIRDAGLRKTFPEGSEVYRIVGSLGGWIELGKKGPKLIGQTEQRFLNAFAEAA